MGVLQRIALVYLVVSLLLLHTRWRVQALVAGALLLLYWALMSLPGFPLEPGQDLGASLDRAVFGPAHLWRYTHTWDPEGLLSTLPAIATGLFGVLTGQWLRSPRDRRDTLIGLFLFGFLGILVGTAWSYVFPLNKHLWTSSFAVYTAGYALMFLAFWYWLTDVRQAKALWTLPAVWLGTNPLLAYCGAQIGSLALRRLLYRRPGSPHPSDCAHHERYLWSPLGYCRSDRLAKPALALPLLGPALPQLLDRAHGPPLPPPPLSQTLTFEAPSKLISPGYAMLIIPSPNALRFSRLTGSGFLAPQL